MRLAGVVRRLSLAFSKETILASSSEASITQFLTSSKEKYLEDVRAGKGQGWTVAMGNEAGDLDSVASCIVLSWIRSVIQQKPTVPLVQIQREDLHLRPENLYAFRLAGIDKPEEQLLLLNDVNDLSPFPSTKFAIVDHNRLAQPYTEVPDSRVVTVVDHHEDEQLHKDADPRIIAPAGSCASHIAHLCPTDLPEELANLLLSAIVIDTGGLVQGGKALQVDYDAAAFLLPKSSWKLSQSISEKKESIESVPALKTLNLELARRKMDVSNLSGHDLLRRDYKEYSLSAPHLHSSRPAVKAGLSTVPTSLETWQKFTRLQDDAAAWMKQRDLTILGVLTTFRGSPKKNKPQGKHRREMAWFVRTDANITGDCPAEELDFERLAGKLWSGLEANEELSVKIHKNWSRKKIQEKMSPLLRVRVYKQKNSKATRKAVAPLLKAIVEE